MTYCVLSGTLSLYASTATTHFRDESVTDWTVNVNRNSRQLRQVSSK